MLREAGTMETLAIVALIGGWIRRHVRLQAKLTVEIRKDT